MKSWIKVIVVTLIMPTFAYSKVIECNISANQSGDWSVSLATNKASLNLDQVSSNTKHTYFQTYPVSIRINDTFSLGRVDIETNKTEWLKLEKSTNGDKIYKGVEKSGNHLNVAFDDKSGTLIINTLYAPEKGNLIGLISEFGKCGE
jgi:hypothetical protein